MKYLLIILLSTLFFSKSDYVKDKYIITENGLTTGSNNDYVIINIDSLSASQLYTKSYNYIQEIMKNPSYSLKGNIQNEMLRYEVYDQKAFAFIFTKHSQQRMNISYTVELKFKDGKIKHQILALKIETPSYTPTKYSSGSPVPLIWKQERTKGLFKLNISRYFLWDENGELIQPLEKERLETYFNNELTSLDNYITKNRESW